MIIYFIIRQLYFIFIFFLLIYEYINWIYKKNISSTFFQYQAFFIILLYNPQLKSLYSLSFIDKIQSEKYLSTKFNEIWTNFCCSDSHVPEYL